MADTYAVEYRVDSSPKSMLSIVQAKNADDARAQVDQRAKMLGAQSVKFLSVGRSR